MSHLTTHGDIAISVNMTYWNRIRTDMKMAADLKAMHKAKRIPRQENVWSDPDENGKRTIIGTRTVYDDVRIPRAELHRLAMVGAMGRYR